MTFPLCLTAFNYVSTESIDLIEEVGFPQYVHWFPDSYSRVRTGLHYPPQRILQKVLTENLLSTLRSATAQEGRTALILAGGNQNFVGLISTSVVPEGTLDYSYKLRALALTNVFAARVAQTLGGCDYISTDATACISGTKAVMEAFALISISGYDRVIILAVEDQVNTAMLDFFGETRAVLTREEMEADGILPSAFDPINRGFFIGQGAAVALLETEQSALRAGRMPVAFVRGASVVAERHENAIGQREDGAGYVNAIELVTKIAGVSPSSIDLVKTHGTGTRSNNQAESSAISAVFGADFVATGYKSLIGHTMGPSSLIESFMVIEDAKAGVIRGIRNRTGGDPRYLLSDTSLSVRRFLTLSSGMGNGYGAMIFDVAL